jgi:hypothetical protein
VSKPDESAQGVGKNVRMEGDALAHGTGIGLTTHRRSQCRHRDRAGQLCGGAIQEGKEEVHW